MFIFLGDDAHLETMWFLEKDIFRLVTSVGQKKNSESPRGIQPQTLDALS